MMQSVYNIQQPVWVTQDLLDQRPVTTSASNTARERYRRNLLKKPSIDYFSHMTEREGLDDRKKKNEVSDLSDRDEEFMDGDVEEEDLDINQEDQD